MQPAETALWPKDIGAITLFVEDLQRSKQFYADAFDVPIVYADKRRAILAFSKGPAGESVFAQALAAWDAKPAPPSSDGR